MRSDPARLSFEIEARDGGILADVAPTVLELLEIQQPEAMTGKSLLAGS